MEKIAGPVRIVITGPESSGKTTLSEELSKHFNAYMIREQSREFLESRDGIYEQDDLLEIARLQYEAMQTPVKDQHPLIISDTGLLVMKIWSLYKYQAVDPWIDEHLNDYGDFYFLCKPDLPWVEDPLRENPNDRHILFDMYHEELKKMKASYFIIERENRFEKAKQALEAFLS